MSHFPHHFEENYLKTVFKLSQKDLQKVNNIALAKALDLNPATVLEMVRKLTEKKLLQLLPDKTIQLTDKGKNRALLTIRKHRLWEVFLVNKLGYRWNEVHELAEQLEHIESEDMVNRLEAFLGFPTADPHGDPIPDKSGKVKIYPSVSLLACIKGKKYVVRSFAETSDDFLDYLGRVPIKPGSRIRLLDHHPYDQSVSVNIDKKDMQLSEKVARNILVQPV